MSEQKGSCGSIAVMQLSKLFAESDKRKSQAMIIELPFPPSVNTCYYTDWKTKTRHLSKRGKVYRQNVIGDVLEQHGIFKPFTGPIRATVELLPPDKRIRDIDNYNKALFDSLKHANCYMDDSQIKELHVFMREPGEKKGCTVIIEEI